MVSAKNGSDSGTLSLAAHNTKYRTSTSQPAQQPGSSCNPRLKECLPIYLSAYVVHDLSPADRNIVRNPILISWFPLTSVCVRHVHVAFTFHTTTRSAISRPTPSHPGISYLSYSSSSPHLLHSTSLFRDYQRVTSHCVLLCLSLNSF